MKRVILYPDVIGKAFFDPLALKVLNQWKSGEIRPVTCRELVVIYLKILRRAGVGETNLRRWLWWFTSAERCEYVSDISLNPQLNLREQCSELANRHHVDLILDMGSVKEF